VQVLCNIAGRDGKSGWIFFPGLSRRGNRCARGTTRAYRLLVGSSEWYDKRFWMNNFEERRDELNWIVDGKKESS